MYDTWFETIIGAISLGAGRPFRLIQWYLQEDRKISDLQQNLEETKATRKLADYFVHNT